MASRIKASLIKKRGEVFHVWAKLVCYIATSNSYIKPEIIYVNKMLCCLFFQNRGLWKSPWKGVFLKMFNIVNAITSLVEPSLYWVARIVKTFRWASHKIFLWILMIWPSLQYGSCWGDFTSVDKAEKIQGSWDDNFPTYLWCVFSKCKYRCGHKMGVSALWKMHKNISSLRNPKDLDVWLVTPLVSLFLFSVDGFKRWVSIFTWPQ